VGNLTKWWVSALRVSLAQGRGFEAENTAQVLRRAQARAWYAESSLVAAVRPSRFVWFSPDPLCRNATSGSGTADRTNRLGPPYSGGPNRIANPAHPYGTKSARVVAYPPTAMTATAGGPRSMLEIRKESLQPGITVLHLTGRIAMGRPCQEIEGHVDELIR